jgi:endogenous inhibitor of DNA gyrase (YacG/DUF329 family)
MLCPICKKSLPDPAPGADKPKYFPFCSERCKLIDLGRWLEGKYQIPVAVNDEAEHERDPVERPKTPRPPL